MYFFTSDLHFCDKETIDFDDRPFKSAKQFDKYVLKTWNKQAKKGDTIFVIGDFVDCDGAESCLWKTSLQYVKKVKADIVLICGNNEERVIKYFFDNDFEAFRKYCIQCGFKDVCKNLTLNIDGADFYLVHKPRDCKMDMLNLFGHVHRSVGLYRPYGFNIGCDHNHFRLYSEQNIRNLLKMKEEFWDTNKKDYI